MNRLIIGLGTIACLGFFTTAAQAANGSVAGNMPRDHWKATVQRLEARKQLAIVAKDDVSPQQPDQRLGTVRK
jgi:hypothetical protein